MRIVSWNVRRATARSGVWPILLHLDPDIALLQEVSNIPENVQSTYDCEMKKATGKNGKPQNFGTAIVVKGKIQNPLHLESEFDWVNCEREYFSGNIVGCEVSLGDHGANTFNVISVYSPAWPVDDDRIAGIDVTPVKLEQNPKVWVTEILWSLLKGSVATADKNWIVGGDFNSSETFDYLWNNGPRGNREIMDRLNALGLEECLRKHQNQLVPTFRNPRGGGIIHQIDHIYVSTQLSNTLRYCNVDYEAEVFGQQLSDHLPIIADFALDAR